MKCKIYVTQPFLPPLNEFTSFLQKIWSSKRLTNNGPLHEELEDKIASYLGVRYVSLVTNGTTALQCALKHLNIQGEVITTPYTYPATVHALKWLNIDPIFVDIEPNYCNLDPSKIEAAITPDTSAILAVHLYGNPCATKEIITIAQKYNLKVIYDAAHAFGVKQNQQSILVEGDLSVLSFHATKIYHSIEGGAIVSHDLETKKSIDYLRNFGYKDETSFVEYGINAKMNELQSAMGLLLLNYIDWIIEQTRTQFFEYVNLLANIPGVSMIESPPDVDWNYSYLPIYVDQSLYGKSRDELYQHLKNNGVHGRRYFYPLISDLACYAQIPTADRSGLPVAVQKSEQVICLPIYSDLAIEDVKTICSLIKDFQ